MTTLRLLNKAALASVLSCLATSVQASVYQLGDIFAAVDNGDVNHYRADGTFVETLNIGAGSFTTGMAFDGSGNLYVTGFGASTLAKFDNSGNLLNSSYAAGLSTPESIVFDKSGNFYVGNIGNGIREYNAAGGFQGTVINTRVDWLDLSADQTTFAYTQERNQIKTVSNGLPGTSGSDFSSSVGVFALRYLADGGILVANNTDVKRLDKNGNVIQTYDVANENSWFSLNLDPNGTSFWSGDFGSGKAYKFDIATGALQQTLDTGVGNGHFFGLVVFGEITQGGPPPKSTPDTGSTLALLGIGWAGLGYFRRK